MYKSSRSENQLQFDVTNMKLGQLPGVFDSVTNEGVFFKNFSDDWANGYWEDGWDVEPTKVANTWFDYLRKKTEAWINPAYDTFDTDDDFVCRTVYPENQKRDVAVSVIFDNTNDIVVGWFIDAD